MLFKLSHLANASHSKLMVMIIDNKIYFASTAQTKMSSIFTGQKMADTCGNDTVGVFLHWLFASLQNVNFFLFFFI